VTVRRRRDLDDNDSAEGGEDAVFADADADELGQGPRTTAGPFGMVMIESMACGTPVIAYRAGSVPEVITEGVTGFVVDDLDEALSAAERVAALDRRRVREEFERLFSARRMAEDYLRVYNHVIEGPGEVPAVKANAEAAAVATWKAPPDVAT